MSAADVSLSMLRGTVAPEVSRLRSQVSEMVKGLDAHQESLTGEALEAWTRARGDILTSSIEMHAEGISRVLHGCIATLQAIADTESGR